MKGQNIRLDKQFLSWGVPSQDTIVLKEILAKTCRNVALRGLKKDWANAEQSRKSELPRKVVVKE